MVFPSISVPESPVQSVTKLSSLKNSLETYAGFLTNLGVDPKTVDYCLQIREPESTQGWILHLSTVLSQVDNLIKTVVPFLVKEGVPFKIVMNITAAEDLLSGNLGLPQIGKIITIYPQNDQRSLSLAKKLIDLTKEFKGPAIPTDICLGNIVYTRYGAFKGVRKLNKEGEKDKYIYDSNHQLILDTYYIPFRYPSNIPWPFAELTAPQLPPPPVAFNRIYRITSILKSDTRGNVFKGLYLKNLFSVKKCVLKQGFSYADSDIIGRDVRDKLAWQLEVYKKLSEIIPMPKIYDFIQDESYSLLVMQFINGQSIYEKAKELNPSRVAWADLPTTTKLIFIDYGMKVTEAIYKMHQKGFIHRDIMPVNFMIDNKNQLVLIDFELAYSSIDNKPCPPFKLGTPGFASPEQMEFLAPSVAQDIYSIGAFHQWLFTGLTPVKFNTEPSDILFNQVNYFLCNEQISALIANCLSHDPAARPDISSVLKTLSDFRSDILRDKQIDTNKQISNQSNQKTNDEILTTAFQGLSNDHITSFDGYWYSPKLKTHEPELKKGKQFVRYCGLSEGISGPIYVATRLMQVGVNIEPCAHHVKKNWHYLDKTYVRGNAPLAPGLYYGAAGLALTISECIKCGLISNDIDFYNKRINELLSLQTEDLTIATGLAGQGIAMMNCRSWNNRQEITENITSIIKRLLTARRDNGLWHDSIYLDFHEGDTGICWFLLQCLPLLKDKSLIKTIEVTLATIITNKNLLKSHYRLVAISDGSELPDGAMGLILLFIKAYEKFKNEDFKKLAYKALLKYPPHVLHPNFCQRNGLAGLGELYLEAWKVFEDEQWKARADWIDKVFCNGYYKITNDAICWTMEEHLAPTADLLSGVTGIIHFLARVRYPDQIGYRMMA